MPGSCSVGIGPDSSALTGRTYRYPADERAHAIPTVAEKARMQGQAHPGGSESWASTPAVRRTMQGNRRRDTTIELAVRRRIHRQGLRYRVEWRLPFDRRRTADIVFPRTRLVVFIDGCYWHGCPEHYKEPGTNSDYWKRKITGNMVRDRETTLMLEQGGWRVLRYWEHLGADEIAELVINAVRAHASLDPR